MSVEKDGGLPQVSQIAASGLYNINMHNYNVVANI